MQFRLMTRRRLDPTKFKLATPWIGVQETIRLQLVGPLLLLCVVSGAETVAYALAHRPSSALLWYLNLEVFSIFRKSRVALSGHVNLPVAQLLIISPLALLALAGIVFRRNLPTALSSNLSFVCAGLLLCSWYIWNSRGQVRAASLAAVHMPTGKRSLLLCTLAVRMLRFVFDVPCFSMFTTPFSDFMSMAIHAAPISFSLIAAVVKTRRDVHAAQLHSLRVANYRSTQVSEGGG